MDEQDERDKQAILALSAKLADRLIATLDEFGREQDAEDSVMPENQQATVIILALTNVMGAALGSLPVDAYHEWMARLPDMISKHAELPMDRPQ